MELLEEIADIDKMFLRIDDSATKQIKESYRLTGESGIGTRRIPELQHDGTERKQQISRSIQSIIDPSRKPKWVHELVNKRKPLERQARPQRNQGPKAEPLPTPTLSRGMPPISSANKNEAVVREHWQLIKIERDLSNQGDRADQADLSQGLCSSPSF